MSSEIREHIERFKSYRRQNVLTEILSTIPTNFINKDIENVDKQVLRFAILAEIDAVNLYEQMANIVNDEKIKKVLLDVAKEEKTHIGEFQALLLEIDEEQKKEMDNGKKETEKI